MNKMTVNLSSAETAAEACPSIWNDPETGVVEIYLNNDEFRWISCDLREAQKARKGLMKQPNVRIDRLPEIWIRMPYSVIEKLAEAGLSDDPDSLVLTWQGRLGRVQDEKIVKVWEKTDLPEMPSMDTPHNISKRENEAFEDLIDAHLNKDLSKPDDLKTLLAILWDRAHRDDKPFMGLPPDRRTAWAMTWLKKLIKAGRTSRAQAFRALELIS